MKLIAFIAAMIFCHTIVLGQAIQVDRQVIGTSGSNYSGSFYIDSSVGESIIETGESGNITVTQGFEQPVTRNLIVASLQTTPESCRGASDGLATIEISGCSGPYNILWSNGSTDTSATGLQAGSYTVSIVTEHCQTELAFEIELESEEICGLIFYSGITPNNDGDNDYWHIEHIELPQFAGNEVRIFNRWGDEIWYGKDYDNDRVRWEGQGRSDGNLPDGTYFYVAEVNEMVYKGYIDLTR